MLRSKAVTRKHVVAVITVVLVLATISSAFALQQLAIQGQDTPEEIIQTDILSALNETAPTASNEPTSTPKPSPSPTSTLIPIPVDFTINCSSNVLTVNVDLNDGMSRDEAVLVAQQLLAYAHSDYTYELKSAEVNDAGVWTVSLPWGAVSPDGYQENHGHFFVATIDSPSRTVAFGTCF